MSARYEKKQNKATYPGVQRENEISITPSHPVVMEAANKTSSPVFRMLTKQMYKFQSSNLAKAKKTLTMIQPKDMMKLSKEDWIFFQLSLAPRMLEAKWNQMTVRTQFYFKGVTSTARTIKQIEVIYMQKHV